MNLIPNQKYIHMYIAGEEVVCNNTITIVEELTNTNSAVLDNCYPLSWEQTKNYVDNYYMPKDYSLFKMTYDYTDYNLATESSEDILTESEETINVGNAEVIAFVGVVKRDKPMSLNPHEPHYATLQVLDFKTFLNEGDLFNFVITETTVMDFINQVIGEYSSYNFIVGNIELNGRENQIVGNYSCDQKTLFDVLQYISQITNSIWKVRYIDDSTYAIDFYSLDNLEQGRNLIYDRSYFDENSIIDMSYSFATNDYRNKQVMTSPNIISYTENINEFETSSSDGEYKLDENIGKIISATLDGKSLVVATSDDKENGITADLYYKVGESTITLEEKVLPTQILSISYYPLLPGRQTVLNTDEITRIDNQLNNSGIIARYESRQDATSADELNAIGQTYIQFKGNADINLQVKTINNDIWEVGQVVYFDNNNVEDLKDLSGNYAIKKKTIQIIQNNADSTNNTFYIYEMNNNFNFENAVNYFDNQRAKTIGNIQEGQFINKYIENIETMTITFEEPIIGGA